MGKPAKVVKICFDEVYLVPELEKEILDRLSRIEGHVRGVRKMLEEHKSCDDILIQLAAIKSAIANVTVKLIEGHMDTCVKDNVKRGKGEEALKSLKGALASALKQL